MPGATAIVNGLSETEIINRINAHFDGREWRTDRVFLRCLPDRNSFTGSNILTILQHCNVSDRQLLADVDTSREHLRSYQIEHQCFYWPPVNGKAPMPEAPLLGRLDIVALSPDADCTTMQQLADPQPHWIPYILDDLVFYRADARQFRLPKYQMALPGVDGSFLTWFPPRSQCLPGKVETVDIGVDAHILWFLATVDRLDLRGAAETLEFVRRTVQGDLLLSNPFRLSLYYPSSPLLLYLLSRAICWGKIAPLRDLRERLLVLISRCPSAGTFDEICLASAAVLWDADEIPAIDVARILRDGMRPGMFSSAPLLAWFLQRMAFLEPLAKRSFTHMKFQSEALQWVMLLWFHQQTRT